jgi:hypothetical protein
MLKSLSEVKRIIKENKQKLQDEYGLKEIGIFGSFIRGQQNESSDIDILVEFQKPIGLYSFVRLKNELSELLECNVDLVMKTALKPRIGQRILTEVIYV